MEAFLTSTALVALAEMGDKTQLLAVILAARFGRPLAILGGILVATIANHLLAALLGARAGALVGGDMAAWIVAVSFIVMAGWALVPDRIGDSAERPGRRGAFITTLIAFFLVEMGDKTQLATVALAARFQAVAAVTAGTTLGMMIANVPAVLLGRKLLDHVPLRAVRVAAALTFLALGLWIAARTAGLAWPAAAN